MTRTATADLRWLRALLVTVVAVALGVAAHSLAGGLLPGPAVLVVLGCGVLVVATSVVAAAVVAVVEARAPLAAALPLVCGRWRRRRAAGSSRTWRTS